MRAELLEPRRVRYPRGAYGWTDLRIVTHGHLRGLGRDAGLVYLFLCTVADRQGISFWGRTKMAQQLNLTTDQLQDSLTRITRADLIAVKDRVIQVLPLPDRRDLRQELDRTNPSAQLGGNPSRGDSPEPGPASEIELSAEEVRTHETQARAHFTRFLRHRDPTPAEVEQGARMLARRARALAHSQSLFERRESHG